MAKRYQRKVACLAKVETTYATDAAPTGAANAIQLTNFTLTPIAGEEVSRELLLPYLGNQGVELVGSYGQIEFDVEIAGSGTAGTAPAYGPLLRACGLAEIISAGVSVAYSPVSAGYEAVSLYFNLDGVNHKFLGARGNVSLNLTPKQIPRLRFNFSGLLGTIADTALPAVTLTAFKRPVPVSKANTTVSLHGTALITESLALDLGNQVEARHLIGDESIEIVARSATGTLVAEAASLATKNWFQIAQQRTRGALSAVHGTVAGNIVTIGAPAVEIGRPTYGATQGIANYSIPLMLCPSNGDDEFSLTVT